jgi:hypothetical protein
MKQINKILLGLLSLVMVLAACTKEPPLFFFKSGEAPVLSMRDTLFRPGPADSNSFRMRFNFSNPMMATPLSNVVFRTQVDLANGDFSSPLTTSVTGVFTDSMQNKVVNEFLLARGIPFGETVLLKARTFASYTNNNNMLESNIVTFRFRTYKVPPRVALPTSGRLYLVGNATQGGWNNPVPVPTQEFARIDETTWGGVFNLNGGAEYLVLPVNGSWANKFSVANKALPGLSEGGDFGFNFNDNFPGPAVDGPYKIILDFQQGKFTVEPYTMQHGLPTQLVVVGGATPDGWTNGVGNPQRLTQLNSAEWQINSINMKANDGYLILPEAGSWARKYGVPDRDLESARLSGPFIAEGRDFRSPLEAGNYRIRMNFLTGRYQLTKL